MKTSVVIVAPAGAGKSRASHQLMSRFGCSRIVEEWDGITPLEPGDMAFTNSWPASGIPGCVYMHLDTALNSVR